MRSNSNAVLPYIRQAHSSGCAIACAAMIARRSYAEMHALSGKSSRCDKSLWDHEIVELLERCGVKSEFKERHVLDHHPAILMFDWPQSTLTHCVVWDPSQAAFLDPDVGRTMSLPGYESDCWVESGRHAVVVTRCTPTQRRMHR